MLNQISDEVSETIQNAHNYIKTKQQEKMHDLIDAPSEPISADDTFTQLESIKNSLKECSEINDARVLYFKSEIALGNYQIDSKLIARKMFHTELRSSAKITCASSA